jgi:hypothetical protein
LFEVRAIRPLCVQFAVLYELPGDHRTVLWPKHVAVVHKLNKRRFLCKLYLFSSIFFFWVVPRRVGTTQKKKILDIHNTAKA